MEQNNQIEVLPVGITKPIELKFATLAEIEEKHIRNVLDAVGGSKTKAAKILGVSVKTMYNKLAEYEKTTQAVRDNT